MRNHNLSKYCPISNTSFFFSCFQDIFFFFNFNWCDYDKCECCYYYFVTCVWFILFRIHSASLIFVFISFKNWESSKSLFLLFSCTVFFLLSFWNSSTENVRSFGIFPKLSRTLFISPPQFFCSLCYSDWIISVALSSSLLLFS